MQAVVSELVSARGRDTHRVLTKTKLEGLAGSWGLSRPEVIAWAGAPGSAARWTPSAIAAARGLGRGVTDLDRFIIGVELAVALVLVAGPLETALRRGTPVKQPQKPLPTRARRRTDPASASNDVNPGAHPTGQLRTKRPNGPSKSTPRLRGAQSPPRPLDLTPEPRHPNRPAGWTTTDWINSKS